MKSDYRNILKVGGGLNTSAYTPWLGQIFITGHLRVYSALLAKIG